MHAAYIESCGPAENIRYGELPTPEVGPDEVLVEMEAVAVDPIDTYIRSGAYPQPLPFPFVIGRDVVGTVRSQGKRYAPGDRVWTYALGYGGKQGSFAEQLAVAEDSLYPLPPGLDAREAVATLHSGLTALTGLGKAAVGAGDRVFLSGGSGNVGGAVLQIARSLGARVWVTAGDAEKAEWCRQQGAERVVDYHQEDVGAALREFAPDVFWEATRHFDAAGVLDAMTPGGRIVLMAGLGSRVDFPVGQFYTKNLSMFGFTVTSLGPEALARSAHQLNGWLRAGVLRARLEDVLPLSQAASAHARVEAGAGGKLVLIP